MQTVKFGEISAVAFDIDGTLYRDFGFRIRVWPYIVAHCKFFIKYGKVRKQLREKDFYEDFNLAQAQMVAEAMGCSAEKAQAMLEKNVYIGLRKYYARLNACKGALKLICRLKDAGVKIAVLSDFPPEQKGDIWGIKEKCDLVLGSEQTGCLKPSPYVYKILEEKLETPAEKILYVGNHHRYDVEGSKKAGMKAAWIITPFMAVRKIKSTLADITFSKYSQLENILFDKN